MHPGPRAASGDDPFRHGVASGDPLADRVVLWTRVTTEVEQPEVTWTVARDPDLHEVVVSGRTRTHPDRDFTVKIDVPGLEPATTYHYAFETDGHTSPIGRTRTAPVGANQHLRLAFTSCAKYTDGYFNAYGRIADREDLDLVVHLGDYFYEYGNDAKSRSGEIGRSHVPDHVCFTLDDYRTRYAQTRLDEGCARMHRTHPTVHVFDDHEFADDRWREGASNHDDAEHGAWDERAAAALQAWYEWLPVRMPDPDRPERIYRRLRLGDLVDLLMIDCRSFRDAQATPPELHRTERELLGPAQHEWLCEHLERSDATWRLIGNPIMVGQVFTELLPDWLAAPLAELGILTEEEHRPSPDQWDGYPAARSRLFSFIREHHVDNVAFLSGDVHTAWAVHLKETVTDDTTPLAVEFVTASVTSPNLDDKVGDGQRREGRDIESHVMAQNPHVEWCELDDHGYVLLDITPGRIRAEWWHVDTVLEPSAGETMRSAWEVRDRTSMLVHAGGDRGPELETEAPE